MRPAALIDGITANLESEYQDVEVLRGEPARIASREGARHAAAFTANQQAWLRQQAVIQTEQTEYFGLVLVTPQASRDLAMPLFDRIVESFQLLRSELKQQQMREALERGKALLESAGGDQVDLAARAVEDTYLQCIVDGKELGFIRIREKATTRDAEAGLDVRKWAWIFQPDGGVTHMQHAMFLAEDLSAEQWESRLILIAPPPSEGPREVSVEFDRAIREGDKLLVTYSTYSRKLNQPGVKDKAIEVEASYAPAPWDLLLPRFVDLSKPDVYAFSMYDTSRRGLVLRTFRVVGPTRLTLGGRKVPAFKIEDSEGLLPPVHEMYVDAEGRILRISLDVAGAPMEMVATSREYVERTFKTRVDEAEKVLKQLAPPPPPPGGR
jgi:hypothetical protein